MRMQITFKSGAQVEFECELWETNVRGYRWETGDRQYPKLLAGLDHDEIACVLRLTK